jgi:hypothetical protein
MDNLLVIIPEFVMIFNNYSRFASARKGRSCGLIGKRHHYDGGWKV